MHRAGAIAALFVVAMHAWSNGAPERVIRVGMPLMAETLDPVRAANMQACMLMAGIYDTLYVLDPLANPPAIVPAAAASRTAGREQCAARQREEAVIGSYDD